MKITLITVSYNSEETIRETLESVRAQRREGFELEYLHIDGLSTDSTMIISKEFDDIITTRVSKKDSGIYNALNKGIQMATGDVIGILNSDDAYAYSEVLNDVVNLFKASNVDTLYGNLDYVRRQKVHKISRKWRSGKYYRLKFRFGWMPPHPTFFVRRDLYKNFGKFNEAISSSADYELMFRFLYVHKSSAKYLDKVMIKMKDGGKSNQSFCHRIKVFNEDVRAWSENGYFLGEISVILKIIRKIPQYIIRQK
jgi:glycosyltransferase involved in cell wall biosynthesis